MEDTKISLISQDTAAQNIKELKKKAIWQFYDILHELPVPLKQLINQSFTYKRIPKEYLFSSILFAFSNAAGLAFKLKAMNYTNYGNLYLALIGSRGDVKSPAMELACSPLIKMDNQNYIDLKKKQQTENESIDFENKQPYKRKQFLLQNATVEAALYTHLQNRYSIGIYVDELSYLIEKMANKNNSEGNVWRVVLLQGNTNKHIDVNRKTTESYRLEKSYPTLLGSLQTQKISKLFGNGNLESGFVDRILFTIKLEGNEKISKALMPKATIENYSYCLNNLILYRQSIEEQETSLTLEITRDAENLLHEYSQQLLLKQKVAYDHTKEYISKMMIAIHKLTLLTHLIKTSHNSSFQSPIREDSVQLAINISDFFFTNFQIILEYQEQHMDQNHFLMKAIEMAKTNNIPQKIIKQLTGRSASHISKVWNNKYKKA